jgi:hypothetical protein
MTMQEALLPNRPAASLDVNHGWTVLTACHCSAEYVETAERGDTTVIPIHPQGLDLARLDRGGTGKKPAN